MAAHGRGHDGPGHTRHGIFGVAGMVLFGGVGLLEKIVVLGCIPVGAIGMARLPGRSARRGRG